MSASADSSLDALQQRLAYTFRDPCLLKLAVTHPSYLQDHPEIPESNQRLEFLGDAVLQLVLTEALFHRFPSDREGALSKSRSALSNGKFLSDRARQLDLPQHLLLSASEEQCGGRQRDAALEDALESIFGAVYLDSDLDTARRTILNLIGSIPDRLAVIQPSENPKGQLQERVQAKHGNHALRYIVTHIAGQDHEREYEAIATLNGEPIGTGRGTSKKAAEEASARAGLETLSQRPQT